VPVKRRLGPNQREGRITPEVLALYRRALELYERAGRGDVDWSVARAAVNDLDRALNVKLWETSVWDPIEFPEEADGSPDWERAAALARQLAAADRELQRHERAACRIKTPEPEREAEPA